MLANSQIQWGDVATWVGALATFAAVVVALYLPRKARRDAAREAAARDLDETRRMLLAAISADGPTLGPWFFGTLGHALSEHSHLLSRPDAMNLMAQLQRAERPAIDQANALVEEINKKLGK